MSSEDKSESKDYYHQTDPQYKLRWSEELREKIAQSAKKHNRSMNADIIARLEKSFEFGDDVNAGLLNSFIENIDVYTKQMKDQANLINKQNQLIGKMLTTLNDDSDKLNPTRYVELLDAIGEIFNDHDNLITENQDHLSKHKK
nr:Arc family DNA-binding protein [Acinetobacter bereziniae]